MALSTDQSEDWTGTPTLAELRLKANPTEADVSAALVRPVLGLGLPETQASRPTVDGGDFLRWPRRGLGRGRARTWTGEGVMHPKPG